MDYSRRIIVYRPPSPWDEVAVYRALAVDAIF
jgi:hypothetical protein